MALDLRKSTTGWHAAPFAGNLAPHRITDTDNYDYPVPGHPGTYAYIGITVSDGSNTGPNTIGVARAKDVRWYSHGALDYIVDTSRFIFDYTTHRASSRSERDRVMNSDLVVVTYKVRAGDTTGGKSTRSGSASSVKVTPISEFDPTALYAVYHHHLKCKHQSSSTGPLYDDRIPGDPIRDNSILPVDIDWAPDELKRVNDKLRSVLSNADISSPDIGSRATGDAIVRPSAPAPKEGPLEAPEIEPSWTPVPIPWIPTSAEAKARWKPGFARIGYAAMMLPPEQIVYTREQPLQTRQLLRAHGSLKRGYGHSAKNFQLQFKIDDVRAVNRVLLPVIRQFMKTPFVPVENELLNETYDVQALALEAIQISTVPGMPGMVEAVVQAEEFNWRAYMPGEESFDSTFCYPLYKLWCENLATTDTRPIGWDPSSASIVNETLSGEFKMYLPDEKHLQQLEDLANHQYSPKVMLALAGQDVERMRLAEDFASADTKTRREAYGTASPESSGPTMTGDVITYNRLSIPASLADKGLPDRAVCETRTGRYLIDGEAVAIRIRSRGFARKLLEKFARETDAATGQSCPEWAYSNPFEKGLFLTTNGPGIAHERTGAIGCYTVTNGEVKTEQWIRTALKNKLEGVVSGKGDAASATEIDSILSRSYFVIPTAALGQLAPLVRAYRRAEAQAAREQQDGDDRAMVTADGNVQLDTTWEEFVLPSFTVEQITAGCENLLSTLMPQMQDSPVHQFMGRADAHAVVRGTITDEADVMRLRQILDKEEYLTRRYGGVIMGAAPANTGTQPYAGYMYLKNEICRLMGIGHVLPVRCQITTTEDFPGTFQVELVFTQFNPMQSKRTEPGALDDDSWYINKDGKVEAARGVNPQHTTDGYLQHILRAEHFHSRLRLMELYPDMSLPTYATLDRWVTMLVLRDADKRAKQLGAMGIDPALWAWSAEHCEDLAGVVIPRTSRKSGAPVARAFVDPDFYCAPSFPVGEAFIQGVLDTLSGRGTNRPGEAITEPRAEVNRVRDRYGLEIGLPFGDPKVSPIRNARYQAMEKHYSQIPEMSSPVEGTSAGPVAAGATSEATIRSLRGKGFTQAHIQLIEKHAGAVGVPIPVAMTMFEAEGGLADFSGTQQGAGQTGKLAISDVNKDAGTFGITKPWGNVSLADRRDPEKAIWIALAYLKILERRVRGRLAKVTNGGYTTDPRIESKIWAFAEQLYISGGNQSEISATRSIDEALARRGEHDPWGNPVGKRRRNMLALDLSAPSARPTSSDKPKRIQANYKVVVFSGSLKMGHEATYRVLDPTVDRAKLNPPAYTLRFTDADGHKHKLTTRWEDASFWKADYGTPSRSVPSGQGNKSGHCMRFYDENGKPAYLLDRPEVTKDYQSYADHVGYTQNELDALCADATGASLFTPPDQFAARPKETGLGAVVNAAAHVSDEPDTYVGSDRSYQDAGRAGIDPNAGSKGPDTRTVPEMFLRDDGRDMFYDMRHYSCHGRLVQAFPTYALLLVDGGRWLRFWRLYDHLYGMTAVESIEVTKSRKRASDVANIVFANMFGHLARRPVENNIGRLTADGKLTGDGSVLSWSLPMVIGGFQDSVAGGFTEQDLVRWKQHCRTLLLKAGTRLHVRMGYGSNPNKLPVLFNGVISEVTPGGDSIEVVALGDGIELEKQLEPNAQTASGQMVYRAHSLFGTGTTPRELINGILAPTRFVELVTMGGYDHNNPHGIEHFGSPTYRFAQKDISEVAMNVYDANPSAVASDANVVADSTAWRGAFAGLNLFAGSDQNNLVFGISMEDATAWDVFTTCRRAIPECICAVHPFGLRSTVFYGKPHWPLRFDYRPPVVHRSTPGGPVEISFSSAAKDDPELGRQVLSLPAASLDAVTEWKPFSQVHVIASTVNLISNKIRASDEDVYTICQAVGSHNGLFAKDDSNNDWSSKVFVDTDIYPEYQKLLMVPSGLYSTGAQKAVDAIRDINAADIFVTRRVSNTYAVNTLRDCMKDMYGGHVVIVGDPSFKPIDRVFFADVRVEMSGLIEVKEVTHHLSFATGFVTTVSPDLVSSITEFSDQMCWGWQAQFGHRLVGAMGLQYMIGSVAAKRVNPLAALAKLQKRLLTSGAENAPALDRMRQAIYKAFRRVQLQQGNAIVDIADDILTNPARYTEIGDSITAELESTITEIMDAAGFSEADAGVRAEEAAKKGSQVAEAAREIEAASDGARVGRSTRLAAATKRRIDPLLRQLHDYREANRIELACARVGRGVGEALRAKDGQRLAALWNECRKLKVVEALGRRASVASLAAKAGKLTIWMIAVDSVMEWLNRKLAYRQCLVLRPMMIDGREFVAGINGHLGCVPGDPRGFWDGVIQSLTNIDYQKKSNKGFFYDYNVDSGATAFAHGAMGLAAVFSAVAGVRPVSYGDETADNFDQLVFGGATWPESSYGDRMKTLSDASARMLSADFDAGGAGIQGPTVSDAEVTGATGTGFGRTLANPVEEDGDKRYLPGECNRYAYDVMRDHGLKVGPRPHSTNRDRENTGYGGSVSVQQILDNPKYRKRGYRKLTGAAANNIANLEPGMLIHLSPTHWAIIAEGNLLNENLDGHVQCSRPVSSVIGRIVAAVMPNYEP